MALGQTPSSSSAQTASTPAAPGSATKAGPVAPPAPGDPWPRTITYQGATISIFQPQPESWTGNLLKAYAAVRVQTPGKKDVDYGVIWFAARTEVDKVNRLVTLEDVSISKQSFPTLANNGSAYAGAFLQDLPPAKPSPSTCWRRR